MCVCVCVKFVFTSFAFSQLRGKCVRNDDKSVCLVRIALSLPALGLFFFFFFSAPLRRIPPAQRPMASGNAAALLWMRFARIHRLVWAGRAGVGIPCGQFGSAESARNPSTRIRLKSTPA